MFKRKVKLLVRAGSRRWYFAGDIVSDLEALGVRRGGSLMVHSSLSSLGYVPGGARTVIAALLRAIGPRGTLAMPAHSWEGPGRGDFTFDVRRTPSCVGTISESFRKMPGVVRSLHPTHSVAAFGPRAGFLTEGHENAPTPCGPGTPYSRLIEERSQILFLGTTLDQNTIFHTLEAAAELPYLMRDGPEEFEIKDYEGNERRLAFLRQRRGPDRRFAATANFLEGSGALRQGRVGGSASLLVEASPMATAILSALATDRNFLLESPAIPLPGSTEAVPHAAIRPTEQIRP